MYKEQKDKGSLRDEIYDEIDKIKKEVKKQRMLQKIIEIDRAESILRKLSDELNEIESGEVDISGMRF
jgi:flagellin-specific chaperone FliS